LDELKKKRFLWGVALARAPSVPALIGLSNVLRGMSRARATGLAAVAGGLAEMFAVCGIGAILIGQTLAIFITSSAFSPADWMQNLFSVLLICLRGLMLLFVSPFPWLMWFQTHHRF
jgi:hypothetical protein